MEFDIHRYSKGKTSSFKYQEQWLQIYLRKAKILKKPNPGACDTLDESCPSAANELD